jgi:Thioredoxin-like [2Fe-2S] ferredoxin
MKKYKKEINTKFTIEGQFLGFVTEEDENIFKYMRMVVADEELQVKLSKQARASLYRILEKNYFIGLRPWDLIQVIGEQTLDRATGELRLKAEEINLLNANSTTKIASLTDVNCQNTTPCPAKTKLSVSKSSASKSPAKLLICHRSSCQKKGGRRQHQAIETMLRDRGLHECVSLQKSDCLGKCSLAPNIMLMPGKKRLSGMNPEAIAELLANLKSNN